MPKDRHPWLADDVLPEKKTLDVMHRIPMNGFDYFSYFGIVCIYGGLVMPYRCKDGSSQKN